MDQATPGRPAAASLCPAAMGLVILTLIRKYAQFTRSGRDRREGAVSGDGAHGVSGREET
jgi:hypothetical protein